MRKKMSFVEKIVTREDFDITEGFNLLTDGENYYVYHWTSHMDGCCGLSGCYDCSQCPDYDLFNDKCINKEWVEAEFFHPFHKQTVVRRVVPANNWELKKAGII